MIKSLVCKIKKTDLSEIERVYRIAKKSGGVFYNNKWINFKDIIGMVEFADSECGIVLEPKPEPFYLIYEANIVGDNNDLIYLSERRGNMLFDEPNSIEIAHYNSRLFNKEDKIISYRNLKRRKDNV